MTNAEIVDLTDLVLMPTYRRIPVAFVRGEGCRLWDADGNAYLDFVAGIAVNSLGHGHPALARAVAEQAAALIHTSNLYLIANQAHLAERLTRLSGLGKAFFCNSGAEAAEAAIKLARKSMRRRGRDAFEIVVAEGGFHGRTLGALAATSNPRYRNGFGPLPAGFVEVPYGDLEAVEAAITPQTAAVMVEPVQGEGGVNVPAAGYLPGLREICDRREVLLILDEVQTGMGRTGKMFAFQHSGASPDVMTLAKGLGGGVPIGAVLATDAAASAFEPGDHGSTFGGNPLACAAALAVVAELEAGLVGRAAETGRLLRSRLEDLRESHPVVTDVRGMGLLLAVGVSADAGRITEACREHGLLVNPVRADAIRLAPPLVVSAGEIEQAVEILDRALASAPAPTPA